MLVINILNKYLHFYEFIGKDKKEIERLFVVYFSKNTIYNLEVPVSHVRTNSFSESK